MYTQTFAQFPHNAVRKGFGLVLKMLVSALPSDYSPTHWSLLPHSHCNGDSQSPINIETQNVVMDERLDAFTFVQFDNKQAIKYITNTGHSGLNVLAYYELFLWGNVGWILIMNFIKLWLSLGMLGNYNHPKIPQERLGAWGIIVYVHFFGYVYAPT